MFRDREKIFREIPYPEINVCEAWGWSRVKSRLQKKIGVGKCDRN